MNAKVEGKGKKRLVEVEGAGERQKVTVKCER